MIGLTFLIGIALWITLAVMISWRIPRWIGIAQHPTAVSVLVFPLVLIAPIADELIGRWQFYQLCKREATVTLNPNWTQAKRATRRDGPKKQANGLVFPAEVYTFNFVDLDSGVIFLTYTGVITKGGWLNRWLTGSGGLGGGHTSCTPPSYVRISDEIRLDGLLDEGRRQK